MHWKWVEGEDLENDERIIDSISSLFTFSYTLATAISPVVGSFIYI